MKNFLKLIGIFAFAMFLYSCSKDQDTAQEDTANLITSDVTTFKNSFDYYEANLRLEADIQEHGYPDIPLSQNAIDYYLNLAEYQGNIDSQTANYLLDEMLLSQDMGLETYMTERLKVADFTKTSILTITTTGPIEGIDKDKNFRKLPMLEQDMILGVNDIARSYFSHMPKGKITDDNILGAVSYGASAFMAGMAFCNWPCGIAGGIIGGIFGWFHGPGPK